MEEFLTEEILRVLGYVTALLGMGLYLKRFIRTEKEPMGPLPPWHFLNGEFSRRVQVSVPLSSSSDSADEEQFEQLSSPDCPGCSPPLSRRPKNRAASVGGSGAQVSKR